MATNVTWNGTTYSIPAANELNWSTLSSFLVALGNGAAVTEEMKQAIRVATTSPVTVAAATDFCVVTDLSVAGAVAVNLPAGVNGQLFVIADGKGDAATNNITITPNGAETINGAASYVINDNRGSVVLAYSTTGTKWTVVARFVAGAIITNPLNDGLVIDGASDEIQLRVQGHTTQTSDLVVVEKSDGTDLFKVSGSGAVTIGESGSTATHQANAANVTVTNATTGVQLKLDATTTGSAGASAVFKRAQTGSAREWWVGTGVSGSGDAAFSFYDATAPAIRGTISTSGVWTFNNGAKVKDSGAGSDTLSWYEENSWTPVLGTSGTQPSSVTYSVQVGRYTRIGRVVYITCCIAFTDISGSPTGSVRITGLPYTSGNVSGLYHPLAAVHSRIDLDTNFTEVAAQVPPNTAYIDVYELGDNQATANLSIANIDIAGPFATKELNFSGFYIV